VVLDGLEFALRISGASASQAATVARFEPLAWHNLATLEVLGDSCRMNAAVALAEGSLVGSPTNVLSKAQNRAWDWIIWTTWLKKRCLGQC